MYFSCHVFLLPGQGGLSGQLSSHLCPLMNGGLSLSVQSESARDSRTECSWFYTTVVDLLRREC